MHEQVNVKTGAIFFIESEEERELRIMRKEYPLLKKAMLILLRHYSGPLPEDIQELLIGGDNASGD